MSEAAAPSAPVAAPAPAAQPAPQAPASFNHPLIPPVRKPIQAATPEAMPPVNPAVPEPSKAETAPEPPKAEAAPPEEPTESEVQYRPDDEFQVVVDGKEMGVTLERLIASYQRNEAANARFAEAKRMTTQARELIQSMTTPEGFRRVCKALGKDPLSVADALVLEAYDYERMTPEQRELHDYKRERAEREEREQRAKEEQEGTQRQQQAKEWERRFLTSSVSEMDRLSVPADPELRNELIGRAAAIFREDIEGGFRDSTPQACVQAAWDAYQRRLQTHARALPVDRRITPEERQAIAAREAQERVKAAQVAQQAPRSALPPREPDGKFTKPKGMDWTAVAVQKR